MASHYRKELPYVSVVGIVNSARPLSAKDDSYHFYAMDLITSRGDKLACQVWDNHPLYQTLIDSGEQLLNHKVRVAVANYSAAERTVKRGRVNIRNASCGCASPM